MAQTCPNFREAMKREFVDMIEDERRAYERMALLLSPAPRPVLSRRRRIEGRVRALLYDARDRTARRIAPWLDTDY